MPRLSPAISHACARLGPPGTCADIPGPSAGSSEPAQWCSAVHPHTLPTFPPAGQAPTTAHGIQHPGWGLLPALAKSIVPSAWALLSKTDAWDTQDSQQAAMHAGYMCIPDISACHALCGDNLPTSTFGTVRIDHHLAHISTAFASLMGMGSPSSSMEGY